MIYKPNTRTETTGIYGFSNGILRNVTAVHNGVGRLIWQKVGCCFSTGPWLDPLPWKNELGWKNG